MEEKQNRVILCLGSNLDKEKNIERAAARLRARFVSIRFSDPVYTRSIGCPEETWFLNQVAVLYCTETTAEIITILKEIERSLGRKPEDKAVGHVPIDIDLLSWNNRVLKPDDLRRDYIISGIRSLLPAGEDDKGGQQKTD